MFDWFIGQKDSSNWIIQVFCWVWSKTNSFCFAVADTRTTLHDLNRCNHQWSKWMFILHPVFRVQTHYLTTCYLASGADVSRDSAPIGCPAPDTDTRWFPRELTQRRSTLLTSHYVSCGHWGSVVCTSMHFWEKKMPTKIPLKQSDLSWNSTKRATGPRVSLPELQFFLLLKCLCFEVSGQKYQGKGILLLQ